MKTRMILLGLAAVLAATPVLAAQSLKTGPGLVAEAAYAVRKEKWRLGADLARDAIRTRVLNADDMAGAYNNLCIALTGLKEYAEAIEACDNALVYQPRQWETHNNRGNVYYLMGLHDKALASYYKAMELKPGHAVLRANIARVLRQRKSAAF